MAAPVTVNDLRAYLGQVPLGANEDAILQAVIDRAWSIVVQFLGYEYGAYGAASAKTVVNSGGQYLYLPPHNPGSITSVVNQGGTAISASDWDEDEYGHLYLVAANFWYDWGQYNTSPSWPRGRYTVTAAWGYGTAPASVSQVTLELAVNMWRGKDRGLWSEAIGVDGSGALRFTGGLTNQQKAVLLAAQSYTVGTWVVV